jgi:glycosyltransferase involved in cell wall biosynthesis
VTGRVDRLDGIWEAARTLVVPLRSGSGVRVKILEAFARGVPVVSTSVGCEGLGVQPGVQLAVADEPQPFADETVALLTGRQGESLRQAARAYVVSRHDVEVVGPQLLDAVRRAAGPKRPTGNW